MSFDYNSDSVHVIPRNLYRYKLGKIIMIGIYIGISYGKKNNDRNLYRYKLWKIIMTGIFIGICYENNNGNSISN